MTYQLPLPLPVSPAQTRADFFVAPPNVHALAQIDAWDTWPQGKLILSGAEGAGKTHLAHIWAADSGAHIVAASDLAGTTLTDLADTPVCVEDALDLAGDQSGEEALFHLHNLLREAGQPLLITARKPPAHWPLTLPDLKSRMMAAQVAIIDAPDDDLLSVVLAKNFADHQIVPKSNVIPYLVRHMPRSFAMARQIVAALDSAALARGSRISRPLAAEVLAQETGQSVTELSPEPVTDPS